jgi:23S rRNA (cytosine1962-C5)-methyltransferase
MNKKSITLPIILDNDDKTSVIKNCIRKNYRHIRKWAKRTSTNSFRIYNRDIKEYPLSIDFYDNRFCVQFYSYDREIGEPSNDLKKEIEKALFDLLGISKNSIYWKTRIRRKKLQQYEKIDVEKDFFIAYEYGVKFKINLKDYLDTGLFLDHRETRRYVASIAKDKEILNLFAYTCSFSVHAAMAGASFTKSVDMSNTYTNWGRDNFNINSLSETKNEIVRADCMKFLEEAVESKELYDIIIIDPPTISRSKKMENIFDVQKDQKFLIESAIKLLRKDGVIFFSTNFKKFKLDESLFNICSIKEITEKTQSLDFRNKKSHMCFRITVN